MIKKIVSLFFNSRKVNQVLIYLSMEAYVSAWNLLELVSYGKFGFSRPDLDRNKLAKVST